jgi:hypothetical protein
MAITDYSSLKTAITNWTHRTDLSSVCDDFIQLTEAWLNRELRLSQMETRYSFTPSSEYTSLPHDFLAVRTLQLTSNPVREIPYITPTQMDILDQAESTLMYYTIRGDQLQVNATSSTSAEITYYAKLEGLTANNETNWLIAAHPDVYFYGCLAEAFAYAMDEEQAQKYIALFSSAVNKLKTVDNQRRYGQAMMVRAG